MASAPSSSSASSASGDLKKAIQWLASSTVAEVPEEIKAILDDGGLQDLKDEQQSLNKRRKLVLKLDRLKRAKAQKIAQWAQYKERMALKLKEEQEKFDRDQSTLIKAIEETQLAIDTFGDEENVPEPMEPEFLLQDPEKIRMAKELELAQKKQQETMHQMAEMQKRQDMMMQQLQAYTAAHAASTPTAVEPTTPAVEETRDAAAKARQERQERMRKVEQQMRIDQERERSPRRESQDSLGLENLG